MKPKSGSDPDQTRNRGLTPIFLVLLFAASSVIAQTCKVLDPELQRTYSGPCVDGLAEGEGIATGTAEYRGAFKAGRKHGKGVKSWPNGDRYEGEFVADAKDGYGVYEWGSGHGRASATTASSPATGARATASTGGRAATCTPVPGKPTAPPGPGRG